MYESFYLKSKMNLSVIRPCSVLLKRLQISEIKREPVEYPIDIKYEEAPFSCNNIKVKTEPKDEDDIHGIKEEENTLISRGRKRSKGNRKCRKVFKNKV